MYDFPDYDEVAKKYSQYEPTPELYARAARHFANITTPYPSKSEDSFFRGLAEATGTIYDTRKKCDYYVQQAIQLALNDNPRYG